MVGRDGPMPLAEFEKVIAINLTGTFNMMRLCRRRHAERCRRSPTASAASSSRPRRSPPTKARSARPAYAASKGGVAALTIPAARELSQFGIRVMAIAPGIFGTPMLRALPQAAQDSLGASVPFPKRLGEPREYAELVLFIVRSGYLNGEVIRLDGALRMAPR